MFEIVEMKLRDSIVPLTRRAVALNVSLDIVWDDSIFTLITIEVEG
jgi:hypothetical protein